MNTPDPLDTPILCKRDDALVWPTEPSVFYLMARDGLYLCRNHEFFRSCTPARGFPAELSPQQPFLLSRYPPIPQALFERVVGFFTRIGEQYGAEAGVHLLWDRQAQRMEAYVPPQVATVSRSWKGGCHPVGLHYDMPAQLPPHVLLLGDIHCHVDLPAFASGTDMEDEIHRPGLHVVVGHISDEPPDVHAELVVDGCRFAIDPERVIAGYTRRDLDVPAAWLDAVSVVDERDWRHSRPAHERAAQRARDASPAAAGQGRLGEAGRLGGPDESELWVAGGWSASGWTPDVRPLAARDEAGRLNGHRGRGEAVEGDARDAHGPDGERGEAAGGVA